MTSPRPTSRVLSPSDTAGYVFFIVVGVAIAVWAVVRSVANIVAAIPNRNVRVPMPFVDTAAQAPIGPAGAPVPIELTGGVVTAPSLPAPSLWALFLAEGLFAVVVVTVVTLLLLVTTSVLRGRIFSRRQTVLVSTAGIVALAGVAGVPFFHNMVANGAIAWLSERTYDRGTVSQIDLPSFIGVAFVVALVGTVFAVGDRLQRDTEGLV